MGEGVGMGVAVRDWTVVMVWSGAVRVRDAEQPRERITGIPISMMPSSVVNDMVPHSPVASLCRGSGVTRRYVAVASSTSLAPEAR